MTLAEPLPFTGPVKIKPVAVGRLKRLESVSVTGSGKLIVGQSAPFNCKSRVSQREDLFQDVVDEFARPVQLQRRARTHGDLLGRIAHVSRTRKRQRPALNVDVAQPRVSRANEADNV